MADPRNLIATAVAAAVVVMAGCTEEEAVSAEVLRDRFTTLVEQTQAAVGGEFEVRDPTTPLGCETPEGNDGVAYAFSRVGPPAADMREAADAVRELWEGRGYTVRESEVGPVVELTARTEDDAPIVFLASENATTVGGESGCGVRPDTSESAGL